MSKQSDAGHDTLLDERESLLFVKKRIWGAILLMSDDLRIVCMKSGDIYGLILLLSHFYLV